MYSDYKPCEYCGLPITINEYHYCTKSPQSLRSGLLDISGGSTVLTMPEPFVLRPEPNYLNVNDEDKLFADKIIIKLEEEIRELKKRVKELSTSHDEEYYTILKQKKKYTKKVEALVKIYNEMRKKYMNYSVANPDFDSLFEDAVGDIDSLYKSINDLNK